MSKLVMFKSQLQEYAQKAGMVAPVYDTVMEGPSHEPKFRSSVIVNGIRYDSPPGFHNRKTAEHSAAQVALQQLVKLSDFGGFVPNPVHETGLCKNLLQEYAQKLSLQVPVYRIVKTGEGHLSSFSSSVEIAGTHYMGGAARSKKEAEIKAARTALLAIQSQAGKSGCQFDFSSAISSQLEVYSGTKRDRAFETPSDEGRIVRAKRRKPSKKKGGKSRAFLGKQKALLENSSQAVENSQERGEDASAVNTEEQNEHPLQETGKDQDLQGKVELGSDSKEKEQITEVEKNSEQKITEVEKNSEHETQEGHHEKNSEHETQEGHHDHGEHSEKQGEQKEHDTEDKKEHDTEDKKEHDTEDNQAEQKCPLPETACVGTLLSAVGSS